MRFMKFYRTKNFLSLFDPWNTTCWAEFLVDKGYDSDNAMITSHKKITAILCNYIFRQFFFAILAFKTKVLYLSAVIKHAGQGF